MRKTESAILTYHSIDESGSVISISGDEFEQQMEALAGSSIPVVPLSDVWRTLGSVALTFDDGLRNFRESAGPVLERHGFASTVFVISGYCGRDNQWPGQGSSVPTLPLWIGGAAGNPLLWIHDRRAHGSIILISGNSRRAMREMSECKVQIQQRLGCEVTQFAYPFGSVPAEARPPFELACGTRLSYVRAGADPLDLARIDAYYLRKGPSPGSLFSKGTARYLRGRAILRNLRQWLSQ